MEKEWVDVYSKVQHETKIYIWVYVLELYHYDGPNNNNVNGERTKVIFFSLRNSDSPFKRIQIIINIT